MLLPADLKALKDLATETDKATRSGRLDEAIELNRAFHRKVAVLGGNDVVVNLLDSLWDQIVVSTRGGLETAERASQVHREHEALVTSIEGGAPEQSRVIARDHVLATQRFLGGRD
jgi:DNA-binding GntR family transcriptional regulator